MSEIAFPAIDVDAAVPAEPIAPAVRPRAVLAAANF